MQNMKSLDNLIAKPVLGANDDIHAIVGKRSVEIYSYKDEIENLLREIDEPHRKVLSRQLLHDSYQQ
jgi:hypothetical protein